MIRANHSQGEVLINDAVIRTTHSLRIMGSDLDQSQSGGGRRINDAVIRTNHRQGGGLRISNAVIRTRSEERLAGNTCLRPRSSSQHASPSHIT